VCDKAEKMAFKPVGGEARAGLYAKDGSAMTEINGKWTRTTNSNNFSSYEAGVRAVIPDRGAASAAIEGNTPARWFSELTMSCSIAAIKTEDDDAEYHCICGLADGCSVGSAAYKQGQEYGGFGCVSDQYVVAFMRQQCGEPGLANAGIVVAPCSVRESDKSAGGGKPCINEWDCSLSQQCVNGRCF
jgi:hypothetical protein